MRPLPLALLLALLLAPSAAAHAEETTQMQSFSIGPYYASLEPSPMPLYANVSGQAFVLRIVNASTGKFVPADEVDARAEIYGPGGRQATLAFEPVDERQAVAPVELTLPGKAPVRLVFERDGQTWSHNVIFDVYPDVPFRIRPADPLFDIEPNRTVKLEYEVVDPVSLQRVDALDDLRIRVEHWSSDHRRMLDSEEKALRRESVGFWSVEHRFEEGHYYLRFASDDGGFNYTDLPLLHTSVIASDPQGSGSDRLDAPSPVPGSVLAVLALAALARGRRRA